MSKKIFNLIVLSSSILLFALIITSDINAQNPPPARNPGPVRNGATISIVGDIDLDKTKPATIDGLNTNTLYAVVTSRMVPGALSIRYYQSFATDCVIANSIGQITKNLGPFRNAGLYRLEVFLSNNSIPCQPIGNPLSSQDFSVGGPTGKKCCDGSFYNPTKDLCQAGPVGATSPTACKNTSPISFCEPESSECFKVRTLTAVGKVCKDPNDSEYKAHPDQFVICGAGGGKPVPGCTDKEIDDPNNQGNKIPNPNPGIATAIGCIHTNPAELVKDLLKFVIAIGGGLAFLMMLLGVYQMLSSQGNPETLNAGRERLTSAVIGLLFIIFAVLLLQIIGADILGIPGFSRQ